MSRYAGGGSFNPYLGLDNDTTRAILEIQIADLAEAEAETTRDGSASENQNMAVAASLFRRDLEQLHTSIFDRRMTESIATAVMSDGAMVIAGAREEEAAQFDRKMARQLEGGRQLQLALPAPPTPKVEDVTLSKLAGLYVSERAGRAFMPAEMHRSELDGPEHILFPKPKKHSCVACQEAKAYYDVIKAPCGDEYCRDCLRDLFQASFTDETLFPPKCCRQVIPIDGEDIPLFLSKNIRDRYEPRRIEVATTDRTYCHDHKCATFIDPSSILEKLAICSKCNAHTCAGCKDAWHTGDCAKDWTEEQTRELAREEGWQTCLRCNRLVELEHGCYHMTCICRAEFCYLCGQRWKTCACPQWHNDRLIERASIIVDRAQPANQHSRQRERAVQQAMQLLRERHECDHDAGWHLVQGRNRCENCNSILPGYILRCSACRVQMCVRCQRNRV